MNEQLHTLIVLTPGFPKDEADSTCLPFPQLFVKTLKKTTPSLNVVVLAFEYPFTVSRYKWHGVNVIPFNGWQKGKIRKLLILRMILKELTVIASQNKVIGILSLWLGECALAGKYAAKKLGVPSFTWLMGQDAKKNNRYYRLVRPQADKLIALSDFLAATFFKNYAIKPAHIIPPGIDPTEFKNNPQRRWIDIIGVGSLIPLKQYDIFIHVIEKIVKKHPLVKASICGNGPEKDYLAALITRGGLQDNIQLMDEIKHDEVLALMQQSKILLHTSAYEGFGVVYAEALYAGAHVVGFCKPMNVLFQHQHVADDENSMIDMVDQILSGTDIDHSPVLTCHINETCSSILSLYE